jgi:hypothetical protein
MFFDRTLFMQKQASAITKSCYFQIRNIGCNRSYTTEDACKTLVCSQQVSRRLDTFFQLSSGLITRYISVHLSVIGITLMTKIMASANFTDWFYTINTSIRLILSTIYIFIPVSGCVGRVSVHCFAWGL